MEASWEGTVVGVYYDTHPHWVVDTGCYAVTLRCKGSLPKKIQSQLREIGDNLRDVEPASPLAEQFRRRHFAILEKSLDAGFGYCPFSNPAGAYALMDFMKSYTSEGLTLKHWVIMPNHVHVLTHRVSFKNATVFKTAWRRFKSRSARTLNAAMSRQGPFWQSSWYDRWIRSEEEYRKWIHYLKMNPVKAGLCADPKDYPYLRV